ncbi:unnamed protein product [Pocillopora meandrina]|uniref:G-protein coupled receptors family 1 profile domain-containing protein n=1 Tax=Pocillopora meandrina TaxID=46732 RepID=A0AAU9WHH6_9CNID|nr:unnamed protein product [Pocillopora meandrina]
MAGCKAHAFMIFLLALVSITHLAVISVGKFLTITRSLSRDSYFSKSTVLWIVFGSWMYSLVFSVPPLLGWSRYGLEGTNESCSIIWESKVPSDKAYFGIIFFTCYVLPITLIAFCYYKIHKVSSHVVETSLQINRVAMTMSEALLKKHRKSAMYFLIIIAVFLFSWSPYAIVSFMTILGGSVDAVATSACSVFAKTSFLVNPMLYAIVSRKFRRRMIQAIPINRPNRVVVPADAFHLTKNAAASFSCRIFKTKWLLMAFNNGCNISLKDEYGMYYLVLRDIPVACSVAKLNTRLVASELAYYLGENIMQFVGLRMHSPQVICYQVFTYSLKNGTNETCSIIWDSTYPIDITYFTAIFIAC